MNEPKTEEKDSKRNVLIVILIIGILLCMAVTVWALFFRETKDPVTPDYPPQGVEVNQTPIQDDSSNKLDTPEGGGAINVTYGTAATVSLSGKKVTLYLK